MKRISFPGLILACTLLVSSLFVTEGWSVLKEAAAPNDLNATAAAFVTQLNEDQLETTLYPYDTPKRVDWHFIPMETRKGLVLRDMNDAQKEAAHKLLQSCLSKAGYRKASSIMKLEELLFRLEGTESRERRDPQKYYVTIFGDPRNSEKWGLSFEGHHLSLNFVVENNELIAASPQFLAANPATIKTENDLGFKMGSAVLKREEKLGFDLVNSLDDSQKDVALIAEKAPREIRNAGSAQPPTEPPAGISAKDLNREQKTTLRKLINEYIKVVRKERGKVRREMIKENGFDQIHFAWAGATEPGIGHYYRIQGKSFLIEFVNTQPDAAGNPANHIHCVWRDMHGDFDIPIEK